MTVRSTTAHDQVKYVPLGVVSSMPLVGEVTLIFV